MEEKKIEIPVSLDAIKHGFEIGRKVYIDKLNFPDKWHMGGANELQADVYGFIAETVVCEFFKQPLPELTKQKNDDFDLKFNNLRIDVKKVGYSRNTGRPKITLNRKQFDRKKHLNDAFLFCTFTGAFEQKSIEVPTKEGGFERHLIYLPVGKFGKLWLIGWIKTEDVEKSSRKYFWKDAKGNPKDESLLVFEKNLKSIKELIE